MIQERVLDLVDYGLATGLIEEADKCFTTNRLLELFGLDELEDDIAAAHKKKDGLTREAAEASLEDILKDMLDYYEDRDFELNKNDQLAGVNTVSVSDILKNKYHAQPNNHEQILQTGIHIYPDGVLCNPSPNSKTIHVFTGTWMEGEKPLKRKIVTALKVRIKTKREAALYAKYIRS